MEELIELFPGEACRTEVWVSATANRQLQKLASKKRKRDRVATLLKKLKRCSQDGFEYHDRPSTDKGRPFPLAHEWNGVWRFGLRGDLLRLLGFCCSEQEWGEFLIFRVFEKRGQRLNDDEKALVNEVAAIKQSGMYRRKGERANG